MRARAASTIIATDPNEVRIQPAKVRSFARIIRSSASRSEMEPMSSLNPPLLNLIVPAALR